MSETFEHKPEKSLRDAAIEALKFLGIDDPNAKAVLHKWEASEEREIKTFPEGEERFEAEITSFLYEAEIYFEAGYKKQALEILGNAFQVALINKLDSETKKKIAEKIQEYQGGISTIPVDIPTVAPLENNQYVHKTNPDRKDLIESLQNPRALFNPKTVIYIDGWLQKEAENEGLTNAAEYAFYVAYKRAMLYFDAGFKGEAIKVLRDAKKISLEDGVEKFATRISKDFQTTIDTM